MEEKGLIDTQALLNFSINSLSILCGLIVIIILGWAIVKQPKLVNRISLRLTLAIAIIDVLKAINIILYSINEYPGVECVLLAFSLHWLTLVYILINTIILFNVYVVFVLEYRSYFQLEWCYWAISFLFPLLILIPALVRDKFGFDYKRETCEYKDIADLETIIYNWAGFLGWLFVLNFAAIYMVVRIMIKLLSKHKSSLDLASHFNLRKLVIRISLQCFIPIITHLPLVFNFILLEFDIDSQFLSTISIIATDIPGILNFILFSFDPVFRPICEAWWYSSPRKTHSLLDNNIPLEIQKENSSNSVPSNHSLGQKIIHHPNSSHNSIMPHNQNNSYITETIKKL